MSKQPPQSKKHMGYYAGKGFVYIGLIGGISSHIIIVVLQHYLPKTHPLNTEYMEAYGWVPGLFLMFGPVFGCFYYMIKRILHLKNQKKR